MNKIRAVIKQYEQNGNHYAEWNYHCKNHDGIYSQMMLITGGDHEISSDVASWCMLATVGEIYEFRDGEIEIMDFD